MTEWIITSSLLILIVLLVRRIFRGKLSLRLQYALWLVVLVRLLIPGTVAQTGLSVLNYLPRTEVEVSQGTVTAPAPIDGGGTVQTQPTEPAGDGEADPEGEQDGQARAEDDPGDEHLREVSEQVHVTHPFRSSPPPQRSRRGRGSRSRRPPRRSPSPGRGCSPPCGWRVRRPWPPRW